MDIHSKETKHTTHEKVARTTHGKTAYLTKFHSTVQVQRTEYKIQNTGKQQHTQKQQNTDTRKKLLPGIEINGWEILCHRVIR
jgi:hypothetical protein